MYAEFGIEREMHNKLFYKDCINDIGNFHFHSSIELCIVQEGEIEVLINDKKECLRAGEMSVALSFDAHAYKTINHSKSSLMIIPTYMCNEFVSYTKYKRPINPFIYDKNIVSKIKGCFEEIKDVSTNEIKRIGYIYTVLGIVMDALYFEPTMSDPSPELSSKILFYLHENYKNDITLQSLSAIFGYSQSYLSRYFKRNFNIGINHYLTIIRLKNAILLMRENKHNITQCAIESGFASLRTFYRVFYNEFGCTPRSYFSTLDETERSSLSV